MYCHHARMLKVTRQLSQERKEAQKVYQKAQKSGRDIYFLKSREQALLNPERVWLMAKSAYNQDLRDYAFLYLAFNVLEDSLRRAVDTHYSSKYSDNWFQNTTLYPVDLIQKFTTNRTLNKLCMCGNGNIFMERLSFGETIAFIYDAVAWDQHETKRLFTNRFNWENGNQVLPNLSRCQVYQKLTTLQWRRNAVYHHNLIARKYKAPCGAGCSPHVLDYKDGTFANTRERIYEAFKYLGLRPTYVMERIVGASDTISLP